MTCARRKLAFSPGIHEPPATFATDPLSHWRVPGAADGAVLDLEQPRLRERLPPRRLAAGEPAAHARRLRGTEHRGAPLFATSSAPDGRSARRLAMAADLRGGRFLHRRPGV